MMASVFNGLIINHILSSILIWIIAVICILLITLRIARWLKMKKTLRSYYVQSFDTPMLTLEACEEELIALAEHHKHTQNIDCRYLLNNITHTNHMHLKNIRRLLSNASPDIVALIPAASWLLGNYYDLYLRIKTIQSEIPKKLVVPVLLDGKDKGVPRICVISCELIQKLGARLSEENIISMLRAYQSVTPLTSSEIWMLRQALNLRLVENIVFTAKDIFQTINAKQAAHDFVNLRLPGISSTCDIKQVLNMSEQKEYINNVTFCSHVIYKLNNVSLDEALINKWASSVCSSLHENPTSEIIINEERSFETHLEFTTRTLFTGLRLIKSFDYTDLFEAVSPIEKILRCDPAGVYLKMDYKTRDMYRTALEKIALRFRLTQWELAEKVVGLASAPPNQDLLNSDHIGTYLIGKGRRHLISALKGRKKTVNKKINKDHSKTFIYFTLISAVFMLFEYHLLLCLTDTGHSVFSGEIILTFIISVPLILGIALELINFIFTTLLTPKALPSLDFINGVPDEFRTLVVLPVLLGSPEQAVEYVLRIEKHFLANSQSNLFFALLGDFTDAAERDMPGDNEIVRAATEAVNMLNNKHSPDSPRFSLLIRCRIWNSSEGCWMGWERKRGKLEELNALLCGETDTSYTVFAGNVSLANRFKYVITIDGDTDLVRESAAKMVGTAAHPLNRPVIDPETNRITEGFAIIQPRVSNHLSSKDRSLFSRAFACSSGIDTYSVVTSDVYHDVCSEGIFVGKGLYDIAAVYQMLNKTFPENSVLSHDLIESCYTRCAFQSDTVLLDNYPSSTESFMRREHRWIRGDWQLLPWLFRKTPINLLSKWKIADNIRRSVCDISELAFIFVCAALFPESVFLWIPIVLFRYILNFSIHIVKTVVEKIINPQSRILFVPLGALLLVIIMRMILSFTLIPYRAWIAADAILRTLFRLLISHNKLLQWQASEIAEKTISKTFSGYLFKMIPAEVFGTALLFLVGLSALTFNVKIAMSLIALLWLLSPLVAYIISKPLKSDYEQNKLSTEDEIMLRNHARRIWQYTVDFATEDNNWLCPDNYQSYPVERVAYKTSPTNIGLQFLSLMTARDLGYIGIVDFIDKCERLIYTVQALPKWNGHLYNWYNTKTLEVLNPNYVSTVDSGNFIAYAITLKNGLNELLKKPLFKSTAPHGINDTLILADCKPVLPESITSADEFYTAVRRIKESISTHGEETRKERRWVDALSQTCDSVLLDEYKLGVSFRQNDTLFSTAAAGVGAAGELLNRVNAIIGIIDELVRHANFACLYDFKRNLLHIGYRVNAQMPDESYYDLAASEAIQTSFIAIAKGDIPISHWKYLGRPLTLVHGIPAFVSWSGTMFEYLMPTLVMKFYRDSSFAQSIYAAVRNQIDNTKKSKTPWGLSESQFSCFDTESNYQYKAFGVAKMRMESGLDEEKVISPYSTFLALPFVIQEAIKNLRHMERLGAMGRYGLYEAIDYNSPDADLLKEYSIVKSFMAHHLGMSLAAINNSLNKNLLQKRFHSEPLIAATEPLLEEKRNNFVVAIASRGYFIDIKKNDLEVESFDCRYINSAGLLYPRVNWLSNRHYSMLITSDGDGFSVCNNKMLYRWRADLAASCGNYIYIRDTRTGKLWSSAYKPTNTVPDEYQVIFQQHKSEFKRRDGDISAHTSVTISASADLEIRELNLSNYGGAVRELETTSYFEVVMDSQAADIAHPLFNKMFGEFEYIPEKSLLIYKRRSDSDSSHNYLMHTVCLSTRAVRETEFETDRRSFLGRNRTNENPAALYGNKPLGNTAGFSLDPIMSLRTVFRVPPKGSVTVTFITAVCDSRDEAVATCDALKHQTYIDDVFDQFRISSILELKYLRVTSANANQYMEMISPLFYPAKEFRGPQESLRRNWKDQSAMWRFGISGDNPIMLLRVSSSENLQLIKDVLNAYEYLRINNIPVDLVILNEQPDGYNQDLNRVLYEMTANLHIYDTVSEKRSLFILQAYQMSQPETDLFLTVARLVFTAEKGLLFREECAQIEKKQMLMMPVRQLYRSETVASVKTQVLSDSTGEMEFYNGCGGFVSDGKEYEIILTPTSQPPAPWINVISNDSFGFLVSETGSGYSWSGNSRENKISSYSNDPVIDMPSEALYVRDDDTGDIFLPCCLGAVEKGEYSVRHGFGYSKFKRTDDSIEQNLTVFVPVDEPLRIWHLSLTNRQTNERHISVTLYTELVLGVHRDTNSPYVMTGFEENRNCMTAKTVYNFYFRYQTAFLFSSERIISYTGDRSEFLGLGGTVYNPASIHQELSGNVGAGLDPCAAIRVSVTVPAGETKEIIFGLGESGKAEEIDALCGKYREISASGDSLSKVNEYWDKILGKIRVKTEDRAFDIMANGWLQYQALSCRITARTALYQCGGAYGFRDQLQDVLAFLDSDPAIAKRQILLAASHQYPEGDVQHWWHPVIEQGVRTRISDDLLWLVYTVSKYVLVTEDVLILDIEVPFLVGPILEDGEAERMHIGQQSQEHGSIYEHCLRALNHVRLGSRGLPLMGGGDWNDGMNRVGIKGEGESVWLGWFFITVCKEFARICKIRNDSVNEEDLQQLADMLKDSIENYCWDGKWYLRAFYDDGEKLGSSENTECQIDSISQSWSVISGAGDTERTDIAMRSANKYLIKADEGISLLLDPPFEKSEKNPGYIMNYYPGMRENGGQYTHASVWLAIANMRLKNRDTAYQLLGMLNPINRTLTADGVKKYLREPYVIAADISSAQNYAGQGGWSWYTGSASWLYQAIINCFLGIRREGCRFFIEPAVPARFGSYTVHYRYETSLYIIKVNVSEEKSASLPRLVVDGTAVNENMFLMVDDGREHDVVFNLMY